MSSSELQYIVELSGQCLLPVYNADDNHAPISERLQLLRDKAHAWFKFNAYSFQTIIPQKIQSPVPKYVSREHLIYSWNHRSKLVTISPIPSDLSQRTIEHNWSSRTLCPFPHAVNLDVLMDPVQNLFAIAYNVDKTTYIYLAALDDGHVHPHAAGPALVLGIPGSPASNGKLKCYGRHIALCLFIMPSETWQLQIWDWQHSTTFSSVLRGPPFNPANFCFLGNDRLLIGADNLKLFSIEDMSETPKLLACFLLPPSLPPVDMECTFLAQSQTQAQSSDPAHRLMCLTLENCTYLIIFFISTKVFFDIDQATATTPLQWNHWGPAHLCVFKVQSYLKIQVHMNRVLLVLETSRCASENELRILDFSPLAVTNRRGLGRVVKQRTTIVHNGQWDGTTYRCWALETSLPYVEVASDRKLGAELKDVWMDEDRIYLLTCRARENINKLEVIDIY